MYRSSRLLSRNLTGRVTERLYSSQRRLPRFQVERFWGWDACPPEKSLSSSECESLLLNELLSFASEGERHDFQQLSLGYTMQAGSLELRDLVLQRYQQTQSTLPSQSQVTIVAPQEGIYLSIMALLEKNNSSSSCIVTWPSYQSLHSVAWSLGCDIIPWHVQEHPKNGCWWFDVDQLEDILHQQHGKTKLVVCNFPNNPTGALPTVDDFYRIVNLCQQFDVWLLVDEMYFGLEHNNNESNDTNTPTRQQERRLPYACQLYDKAISLGGLSKTFGLPGLRVGWIVSHDTPLMNRIQELKDYTTICTAAPSEALATLALRHSHAVEGRCVALVEQGLETVQNFIAAEQDHLSWLPPQGGTFGLVRLKGLEGRVSQYCDEVIQKHGIMLIPGKLFGIDNDDHVRICYGSKNMSKRLEDWKSTGFW